MVIALGFHFESALLVHILCLQPYPVAYHEAEEVPCLIIDEYSFVSSDVAVDL